MVSAALYLWDFAVAVGVLGFGMYGLRILRIKKAPLALAGVVGISFLIAVGGWLNLLHLLRPDVFFTLIGSGFLLAIFELSRKLRNPAVTMSEGVGSAQTNHPAPSLYSKILYVAAMSVLGLMILGGVRQTLWNGDDLQGYAALAVKASQLHSIQPDPFCERRVQTGVGGANFLDTMMLAEGDLRAMPFTDSVLGLLLYALGLWTIGRRWRVPSAGIAFALLCLPFATLVKLNLTIIYLSAAAFFAMLILLNDIEPDERFSKGRILALGLVVGASATTKSPNIVFAVPFLVITAMICNFLQPRIRTLFPVLLSLLVALAVFAPYSIASKSNAGTYLYPLLGSGFHVSAYHFIARQSHYGTWQQIVVVLAPNVLSLAVALFVSWKLTAGWNTWPRAALLAFLIASLLAVIITGYGIGGEDADRYTAPFVMPSLLLFLLLLLKARNAPRVRSFSPWVCTGIVTLFFAAFWIFLLFGVPPATVSLAAQEALHMLPSRNGEDFTFTLSDQQIREQLRYGEHIQAAIPPGGASISLMSPAYIFDFRRNPIDIVDFPGMSSPPPGLPITQGPAAQKRYLVNQGVQFIIYDRDFELGPVCNASTWNDFLQKPVLHHSWKDLLGTSGTAHVVRTQGMTHVFQNLGAGHAIRPWSRVEGAVSCHEREMLGQIVQSSPHLYDDGRVIVARIN